MLLLIKSHNWYFYSHQLNCVYLNDLWHMNFKQRLIPHNQTKQKRKMKKKLGHNFHDEEWEMCVIFKLKFTNFWSIYFTLDIFILPFHFASGCCVSTIFHDYFGFDRIWGVCVCKINSIFFFLIHVDIFALHTNAVFVCMVLIKYLDIEMFIDFRKTIMENKRTKKDQEGLTCVSARLNFWILFRIVE